MHIILCTRVRTKLLTQHYHHGRELEEEPEPEWMEFGPTDRFDVIELKGFDKEELEREGTVCDISGPSKSTIIPGQTIKNLM